MSSTFRVKHVRPPEEYVGDADARAEADAFDTAKLDEESRKKDHQRGESLKLWLHWLTLLGISVMAFLLLMGVVIWALHALAPDNWHWLSTPQRDRLREIMSSALLAIVVTDYKNKVFGKST